MVQCIMIYTSEDAGGPEGTVTGPLYLRMRRASMLPAIPQLYVNQSF
jgi:hypothetical protein